MQSITHLINSIESFSKQNFKFSQYFQPLNILNKIPDSISDHLNNVDFIYHLDEASKHIDWLNDFFENNINPITKKQLSHLKSSKNKDIQIPYADFKVDEPPLFKNDSVQQLFLKISIVMTLSHPLEEILILLTLMVFVLTVVIKLKILSLSLKTKLNLTSSLLLMKPSII